MFFETKIGTEEVFRFEYKKMKVGKGGLVEEKFFLRSRVGYDFDTRQPRSRGCPD